MLSAGFEMTRLKLSRRVIVTQCGEYADRLPSIAAKSVDLATWPSPPQTLYLRSQCSGVYMPTSPGVYFAADVHGEWKYVGMAKNLKKRLTAHDKIQQGDFINWLEFDIEDICYAEAYYIGLLRPYENFGSERRFPCGA